MPPVHPTTGSVLCQELLTDPFWVRMGADNMQRPRNPLLAFLFMVVLLLPWLIFFLPGETVTGHALFWLAMFFCLLLMWLVSAGQRRLATAAGPDLGPRMLDVTEQPEAVRQTMDVRIATIENGVQVFRGPLRDSPDASFEKLKRALPEGLCTFDSGR